MTRYWSAEKGGFVTYSHREGKPKGIANGDLMPMFSRLFSTFVKQDVACSSVHGEPRMVVSAILSHKYKVWIAYGRGIGIQTGTHLHPRTTPDISEHHAEKESSEPWWDWVLRSLVFVQDCVGATGLGSGLSIKEPSQCFLTEPGS